MAEPGRDVTELLLSWSSGDEGALDDLTPLLYDDLRRLARDVLARERADHTLSATALVHEVYMRLVDQRRVTLENRTHFFGVAAHIMRRVLVDHARARSAVKRGGDLVRVAVEEGSLSVNAIAEQILDLDSALTRLGDVDARKVRVVEMKFFGGMTNQEVSVALGISDATVERDWKLARAWLITQIAGR